MPIASKLYAFARIPARRAVFAAFSARRTRARATDKKARHAHNAPSERRPRPNGKARAQGAKTAKDLTRMIRYARF